MRILVWLALLAALVVLGAWLWLKPGGGRDLSRASRYIGVCFDDYDPAYNPQDPFCAEYKSERIKHD